MSAKDRPFTRLAVLACLGKEALDRLDWGECPMCKSASKRFRDEKSRQEYEITGLCQACQDRLFVATDDVETRE